MTNSTSMDKTNDLMSLPDIFEWISDEIRKKLFLTTKHNKMLTPLCFDEKIKKVKPEWRYLFNFSDLQRGINFDQFYAEKFVNSIRSHNIRGAFLKIIHVVSNGTIVCETKDKQEVVLNFPRLCMHGSIENIKRRRTTFEQIDNHLFLNRILEQIDPNKQELIGDNYILIIHVDGYIHSLYMKTPEKAMTKES